MVEAVKPIVLKGKTHISVATYHVVRSVEWQTLRERMVERLSRLRHLREQIGTTERADSPKRLKLHFRLYSNAAYEGKFLARFPVPAKVASLFEDYDEVEVVTVEDREQLYSLMALGNFEQFSALEPALAKVLETSDLIRFPFVVYFHAGRKNNS